MDDIWVSYDSKFQEALLKEYLGKTKPSEWNYLGWLDYWHSYVSITYNLNERPYELPMFVTKAIFNRIVQENIPPLYPVSEPHKQEHGGHSREEGETKELPYDTYIPRYMEREFLNSIVRGTIPPPKQDKAKTRQEEETKEISNDIVSVMDREKESFKQKVLDSEWYNTCSSIRKPFIWLGSIRELAIALSEETGLLEYRLNQDKEEIYIADVADCLFIKESTGKPITHEQLYNAAKQAHNEDNKIKFSVPKKHK